MKLEEQLSDQAAWKKWYWTLQGVGWTIYFFINLGFTFLFEDIESWPPIVGQVNFVFSGFLLTHYFRKFIYRRGWSRFSINVISLQILGWSLLLALIWALWVVPSNTLLYTVTGREWELSFPTYFAIIFPMAIIMLLWMLIYFGVHTFMNFKGTEIEKWKLEAAVKDAELIALKSQINPHFIFNSLNNIRSLVIEDPEKARSMITHLSDLLRYSIKFNIQEKITLEHELEVVRDYLELESIQYEDRLRYMLNITPETLEFKIPPMSVQLLVENAIKHGISKLPKGGEVRIKSFLDKSTLVVEVENTGVLQTNSESTGIGLRNASERLKLLFGRLANLEINNTNNNMVKARFTIPVN